MAKNILAFKTKGMSRDMSVSSFNPEFSFENKNLRLSTIEGNTMMSWVTERGPKKMTLNVTDTDGSTTLNTITGVPIGTAVINHQLVLFVHDNTSETPDSIYVLKGVVDTAASEETLSGITGIRLFQGNLNFNQDYPLETLVSYESENVQKVYWTDNYNQPRVINITAKSSKMQKWNEAPTTLCTYFDFAPDINLDCNPQISVEKVIGGGGNFAAGVIQYALTYYNKYGQETAIFRVTPLLYVSYSDRGVAPDDSVDNVFKITLSGLDTSFDYVRIYSIQRTSLNDTPITKRVQDIYIGNAKGATTFTYTDTGYSGDSIDPTELLYKGSEDIRVKTLEQKDGTLFLGNIKDNYLYLDSTVKTAIEKGITVTPSDRTISIREGSSFGSGYAYYNHLNAYALVNGIMQSVPCGGFKTGDYYRLGLQFQYKTGKWSEPIRIGDYRTIIRPKGGSSRVVILPTFEANLNTISITEGTETKSLMKAMRDKGYRFVRPVVVFPEPQDRVTICQGVVCPTVSTQKQQVEEKSIYAQSSWFFRTTVKDSATSLPPMLTENGAVTPLSSGYLACPILNETTYNPNTTEEVTALNVRFNLRQMEVEGLFTADETLRVNRAFYTLHSPELEFDEFKAGIDLSGVSYQTAGYAYIAATYSDIDIQTSSPTISDEGSGFIHKSFSVISDSTPSTSLWKDQGNYGIVSGLFYNDYIVDDDGDGTKLEKYPHEKQPVNWMVYLWHATESLNNDINRPSSLGTSTAVLQKKIVSNLRYSTLFNWREDLNWDNDSADRGKFDAIPQLFDSDECTIVKLGDKNYMGNMDNLLIPSDSSGKFFTTPSGAETITNNNWNNINNKFTNDINWKAFAKDDSEDDSSQDPGLWYFKEGTWTPSDGNIGDNYSSLVRKKTSVRMKYKSTPHIVVGDLIFPGDRVNYTIPIVELVRSVDPTTLFGGTSEDALKENTWVPCGEPVWLSDDDTDDCTVKFEYGDTYYQRWDCLKTYPFTTDDINQVVEIGSFPLETRYNIAGRYDRNRGQLSNLYMNPGNFNLFNPVYSQIDNFFSYKITDEDTYENNIYPNQLAWTLTKNSNADVDEWTHITLANTLELDGDKGSLNKIVRYNDMLLAFQDTGISQVLYNENTQISTTEGVPIEIANSGKVQGKRYLSSTKGCANKWTLKVTPLGIYFMDSYDRSINVFTGEGLQNLSSTLGFNSWCKQQILNPAEHIWTPQGYDDFVVYYDRVNQDVLFINHDTALAYSEKFGTFTSFYDYGGVPYLVNLDNTALWVDSECTLWEHNKGEYCNFFDKAGQPYWMTLVGNPEPQKSKVFTNLEIRATVDGDGEAGENTFTPILPFVSLETWDEYQHGYTELKHLTGVEALKHRIHWGEDNSLKRKFRIWRCDIPRDNTVPDKLRDNSTSYPYSKDVALNCFRTKAKPMDRMRNPWIYLHLKGSGNSARTEVHDVVMGYYS